MEVFSNEIGKPPSDQFPDKISPFPTSFESETIPLLTPDTTPFPPQKLRPIRCNALVYKNNNKLHAGAELVAQSSLEQVGFVTNQDELVAAQVGWCKVRKPAVVEADMNMRAIAEVEINKGKSPQACSSSSTSESEVRGELLENAQGLHNRKRKRTRKSIQCYMEKFVNDVIVRQEMMHNKLMEMLERKERERLMREETWKQQEMERRMREEQVRAQETACNVAIITFIQKITGQDFQPLQMDKQLKVEDEVYQQRGD